MVSSLAAKNVCLASGSVVVAMATGTQTCSAVRPNNKCSQPKTEWPIMGSTEKNHEKNLGFVVLRFVKL